MGSVSIDYLSRLSPLIFQRSEFAQRIDQIGYVDSKADYVAWLSGADIILATATHEFQGLSVLEAVAAGCIPVLPDRLAYAELFESGYKYPDCGDDIGQEAVKNAGGQV